MKTFNLKETEKCREKIEMLPLHPNKLTKSTKT